METKAQALGWHRNLRTGDHRESGVWDGFSFASHFSSCITRCLFYYFYLPMLDTDGRNGRLIFFNSISLFCDTFRHGSVTAKAGLRVEPAIRQKSD